ncbi:MAG: hypothetical protein WBF17_00855 [Phycisphaerae bacterium]
MLRRRMVLVVLGAVIGGGWLAEAISQPRGGGDRPGGDPRRGGARPGDDRGREDFRSRIEEFRRRMSDQMREDLGCSEDEWKVLQPRIEKVQELQRQGRGGFRGFGGRGGRGRGPGGEVQRPEGAPEQEQPEVEKKTEALRSLLDDKASGAQAIKAALAALRKAREQAQQKLVAARKDVREVVTMRQEARLVLMGILD